MEERARCHLWTTWWAATWIAARTGWLLAVAGCCRVAPALRNYGPKHPRTCRWHICTAKSFISRRAGTYKSAKVFILQGGITHGTLHSKTEPNSLETAGAYSLML